MFHEQQFIVHHPQPYATQLPWLLLCRITPTTTRSSPRVLTTHDLTMVTSRARSRVDATANGLTPTHPAVVGVYNLFSITYLAELIIFLFNFN